MLRRTIRGELPVPPNSSEMLAAIRELLGRHDWNEALDPRLAARIYHLASPALPNEDRHAIRSMLQQEATAGNQFASETLELLAAKDPFWHQDD